MLLLMTMGNRSMRDVLLTSLLTNRWTRPKWNADKQTHMQIQ